jgi:hypothetical protein
MVTVNPTTVASYIRTAGASTTGRIRLPMTASRLVKRLVGPQKRRNHPQADYSTAFAGDYLETPP